MDTKSLEIVGKFHRYVKPEIHPTLTPFCTSLTGIIQVDIPWTNHQGLSLSDFHLLLKGNGPRWGPSECCTGGFPPMAHIWESAEQEIRFRDVRRLGFKDPPSTPMHPYGTRHTCLFQIMDQYQDGKIGPLYTTLDARTSDNRVCIYCVYRFMSSQLEFIPVIYLTCCPMPIWSNRADYIVE